MQPKPYLLFDAGGTIVFPDQSFLIQQARIQGIKLTHKQLYTGYYKLINSLDCQAYEHKHHKIPRPWPKGYAYALFKTLGMVNRATDAIAQAFQDRHRQKNLWTFTFPWVPETLSQLVKQGYRMSVLSNSDGRTEEVIRDLGLDCYFEQIFDSVILGIEKPKPGIFKKVLDELSLQPTDALYVGDIFYVDVLGANRAGLGGIHLDPLNLYIDWPGIHLTDLRYLPNWLTRYAADPSPFNLFPTKMVFALPTQTYSKTSTYPQSIKQPSLVLDRIVT